jgi:hypothetical protein
MQRKFQYQKRNAETVKQRANQRGGDFDNIFKGNVKLFKPREGKNLIRILPPTWENAEHYGYEVFINYSIGVDDQAYLSLSKMLGKPDPLAEARKQAEREGDKKTADSLIPSKRVLMYVIDRNAEEEGVQLWSAPWTVDKTFCNLSFDEDTREVIMVDDPEQGCDIRFYKEGTGLGTKYPAEKAKLMKPSMLHEDEAVAEEWLQYVQDNPLPSICNYYDYEHIASAYEGHVVKDKPEAETKPETKPKSSKPSKVEQEPEDDDDEDEALFDNAKQSPKNEEDVPKMSAQSIRERLAARKRTE